MDIRVYAHHGYKPAPTAPPAPLTTGYPGWPPLTASGAIPWPPGAGPAGPWIAWAELARRTDVEAANFAGPGWSGAPPPAPDEYYSDTATDFSVTSIRIISPLNNPGQHEYTIRAPSGVVAAVITPQPANSASFASQVSVASGRGIWTIEIRRLTFGTVSTPSPLTGPAPVHEPIVGMFGPSVEGLLRVQFTGEEITTQPCPTDVTISAEVETSPGSGQFNALKAGDCVEPGRNVKYTAAIVPAGTSGVQYNFAFGDGMSSGFSPSNSATHAYAQPSAGITCTVTAWIQSSSCVPLTKAIVLVIDCCGKPAGYWDPTKGCIPCPTSLTVAASKPSGCPPVVNAVTLTATPPPGTPPGTQYTWTIDGPMHAPGTVHAMRAGAANPVQSNSGWSGTGTSGGAVVFPLAGIYSVSLSIQLPGPASKCVMQASTSFEVDPCNSCPPGQHWNAATGSCVPDVGPTPTPGPTATPTTAPTPSPTTGGGGGGGSGFCAGLLIVAVILIILGFLIIVAGVCTSTPPAIIAGAIVAGLGVLLFILWAIFCSMFTACSVMQQIHCVLFWIIAVVAPLLVLLGWLFGGLPCALAAAGAWGGWGFFFAWLGRIMMGLGCPRRC